MKIAVAQIAPVVGDFKANIEKIKQAYQEACSKSADLLLTPELGVCGYPPHDLMDRPEMFTRNERALEELIGFTQGKTCVLAVGHVSQNPSETGRKAQNTVTLLSDGKRVFSQSKMLLPTYDVFDEARYFEPAKKVTTWKWKDHAIAFAICEDLWAQDSAFGRRLYGSDPLVEYKKQKARLILSLSASPYEWGKNVHREKVLGGVAQSLGVPLVYVNQVGATDEILFDGGSFAMNAKGEVIGGLPFFKTGFGILDVDLSAEKSPVWDLPVWGKRPPVSEIEILSQGLITGIKEYFARTGFKKTVIGLSGGIDSAVVGVLAVQALGAENVLGVAMPSQFSSAHSLEDAERLAGNLGIRLQVKPIKFLFSTSSREIAEGYGQLAPVALENLQSRLRGVILMTLSNHLGALVLTTGNKSELATGYCTQYGDMVGALAPIGDLFKTRVYELARFLNQSLGTVIPTSSLTKAPSAELKPNQTDQDTLPAYEILDEVLELYLEKSVSVIELEKKFGVWVREILKKVEINEFKRRQAAPVLKASSKAFGTGRRIPIAKRWDQ